MDSKRTLSGDSLVEYGMSFLQITRRLEVVCLKFYINQYFLKTFPIIFFKIILFFPTIFVFWSFSFQFIALSFWYIMNIKRENSNHIFKNFV